LQRSILTTGCRWLLVPLLCPLQDQAHVVHDGLKDASSDPALGLLVDGCGGRSCGIMRQCAPVRTSQRHPLKTSRKGWSRCGASCAINVRYGATKAHSSSLTSLG
jgi:hypothetical protein